MSIESNHPLVLTLERFGIQLEASDICEQAERLVSDPPSWGRVHHLGKSVRLYLEEKEKGALLHLRHAAWDPEKKRAILCNECTQRWDWKTGACLNEAALALPLPPDCSDQALLISEIFYRLFPWVLTENQDVSVENWEGQILSKRLWLLASGKMYTVPALVGFRGSSKVYYETQDILSGGNPLACLISTRPIEKPSKGEWIEQEFDILSQLKGVPGIVQVEELQVGTRKNIVYYHLIEEQGATDLQEFLKSPQRSLDKRWLGDLLRGVAQLHDRNCVHRDINPKNVVIDRNFKRVFLIDFELALLFQDPTQKLNKIAGTDRFCSPEKAIRACGISSSWTYQNEKAADVWALGLTLGAVFGFFRLGDLWKGIPPEEELGQAMGLEWKNFFDEKPLENTLEFLVFRMLQPEKTRITAKEAVALWERFFQVPTGEK